MPKHIANAGFTPPPDRALGRERRAATLAELVATIGIAICTVIAATVVTVGIARADVAGNVLDNEGSLFMIALVLGVAFAAMGGLTALTLPGHKPRKR